MGLGKLSDLRKEINTVKFSEDMESSILETMKEMGIEDLSKLDENQMLGFYSNVHRIITGHDILKEKKEVAQKLAEAKKIEEENAYQTFFAKKLKASGFDSISQMSEDERKKFFDEVSTEWKGDKKVSEKYNNAAIEECVKKKKKGSLVEVKTEDIKMYNEKYKHLYEKVYAALNTETEINRAYEYMNMMLPDQISKDASGYFRNFRLDEINQ